MKVAVDCRAFYWTGVGRYVRNLLREYALAGREVTLLVGETEVERVRSEVHAWGLGADWRIVPVEGSYYSWQEQTRFYWQLRQLDVDLVHFVHFNVPVAYRRPYVVTIHDVTRFFWPAQVVADWRRQAAYEWVLSRAVAGAREVVCVSEATRQELMSLPLRLNKPPLMIGGGVETVFQEQPSEKARREWRQVLGWDGSYVLYVGVWMNHKNLRRLLEAFREVVAERPEVRLVITGEYKHGYVPVPALVAELGLEGRVLLPGYVPAELLPAVYAEAVGLMFPSLYEGFGLPLLEAAALGCPVLTSLASSMPEVMGEAAVYVNPDSVDSIAGGMRQLLGDEELRIQLAEQGRERAQLFQWQAVAEEMWAVYEREIG